MKKLACALVCSLVVLPIVSVAEPFKGKLSLGTSVSTGNVDSTNYDVSLNLSRATPRRNHSVAASYASSKFNGTSIRDRTFASYKLDHYLSDEKNAHFFGFTSFEKDKFSNIESRLPLIAGYGKRLVDNDKNRFYFQVGLGYMETTFIDGSDDQAGGVGMLGGKYRRHFSKNTTLNQDLSFLVANENTFMNSNTSLNIAMTERLSLKLGYSLRYNTDVAPGIEKKDGTTSAQIVLNF